MFNKAYKIIIRFNSMIWDGFLGQNPTDFVSKVKTAILRLSGAKIGDKSVIHHRVHVWNPENIIVGDRVLIPSSTDMAGMGEIKIGDDSLIGANVSFITNHHPLDSKLPRKEILRGTQSNIEIGRNVWIMNNVLLIAGKNGLKIGDNSWIAAGSVVTKDIEPNSLYAGVPAKKVREIVYEKI